MIARSMFFQPPVGKLFSSGQLYYGDNLDVLRESIASESVDLIYQFEFGSR